MGPVLVWWPSHDPLNKCLLDTTRPQGCKEAVMGKPTPAAESPWHVFDMKVTTRMLWGASVVEKRNRAWGAQRRHLNQSGRCRG